MLAEAPEAQTILQYPNAVDRQALMELKAAVNHNPIKEKIMSKYKIFDYNKDAILAALNKLDPSIECIDTPHNLVFIKHIPNQAAEIETIINSLNIPIKNISLTFYIYEINQYFSKDIDLLNTPLEPGVIATWAKNQTADNSSRLLDQIKLLEETGEALLISRPSIDLINNQLAEFEIGEKIPYVTTTTSSTQTTQSLQQIATGLKIQCTPKIISNKHITCAINLSIDVVKLWKSINSAQYPLVATRVLQTHKELINNKPALLAHFSDRTAKKNNQQLPWIKKIPLLKNIFGQQNKQNSQTLLCIFLQASYI